MLRSRGIDEDLGTHFLTLELIEGADPRALLLHFRRHGESLDPGLTAYVAHVLASAPDFAHTADENGVAVSIIHRDVSLCLLRTPSTAQSLTFPRSGSTYTRRAA
jgi:serine/threonine protein kinase